MVRLETLRSEIEKLELPEGSVELSVAHLVTKLATAGQPLIYSPAMLSVGAHRNGLRRFDAIGGALALTEKGMSCLSGMCSATDFKRDDHDMTWDARFTVPTAMFAKAALSILSDMELGRQGFFEIDPHREVYAELSGDELAGIAPTIPYDHPDWRLVRYQYLGLSLQPLPDDGLGTSTSATSKVRRRLFHQWQMTVTGEMRELMEQSEAVTFLRPSELDSTNGGRLKGEMSDGTPLGDNLGVEITISAR